MFNLVKEKKTAKIFWVVESVKLLLVLIISFAKNG